MDREVVELTLGLKMVCWVRVEMMEVEEQKHQAS